jgi:hypothetical protein
MNRRFLTVGTNHPFSGKPHAIRMGNEVLEGVVQVIREKKISGRAL